MRRPIRDIEDLKELAIDGCECYIALDYGLRSSKCISWNEEEQRFYIYNETDDLGVITVFVPLDD